MKSPGFERGNCTIGQIGSQPYRCGGVQPGFLLGLIMVVFSFTIPVAAQDLAHDLVAGGSVEARVVYSSGSDAYALEFESGSGIDSGADTNSFRAELVHRGLWELHLAANRFVLAHELAAGTEGNPELVLEQACLSIGLGSSGRLDIGRQEVPLGLGYLFQPVDPLAGADGRSTLDGLALVLNPWANHGLKAVVALDGLWDGSTVHVDGTDDGNDSNLPLGEAWQRLFFGLRYDGLVGAWEPGLAFFFRNSEFLRLTASSRLGLGPAIVRLEGAWDFEQPYLYPSGDVASPEGIGGQPREKLGGWPGGGGMGLAGIDLSLYPAGATLALGVEYAYQSRGFERQERLLAQAYVAYLETPEEPTEPAWLSGVHAGQWDTRHRLGLNIMVQPTDRLTLRGLLVLGMDYPEGVANSMAEAGLELNRPENVDMFLHLRQGWDGRPWGGEPVFSTLATGFRVHY